MRGLRADSAAPPRPPQKSSFNQSALLGSHSDTLGSLQLAGVGWGGGSDTIITLKKYVSHRNLLVEKREQKEKKKKKLRIKRLLFILIYSRLHFPREYRI